MVVRGTGYDVKMRMWTPRMRVERCTTTGDRHWGGAVDVVWGVCSPGALACGMGDLQAASAEIL